MTTYLYLKTMKKFDELSEHITEEEYFNNGRFHYSDIAGYAREGFSYLLKPRKEDSPSLLFGSMVDCIVTRGMDEFEKRYEVSKEFNLSDNQKSVIKDLQAFGYNNLEDIPPQTVTEALEMYYKNPKTQFSKLIEDGSEYYRFTMQNKDKTLVSQEDYFDAVEVADKLLTNSVTRVFLPGTEYPDVDKFYQLKFNGDYEGIPVTAMTDILYIDHSVKKVWIVDLKTTCANYEWEFPTSFLKWGYGYQARLYSYTVRQLMDNDEFYKDYTLEGFIFIYISRTNKTPLLWTFDRHLERGDIEIDTKNGNKIVIKDFVEPLKEMYTIKAEDRKLPLDIHFSNDIIEHLAKL